MKVNLIHIFLISLLGLLPTMSAMADNIAEADSAYARGEYAEAVDLYKQIAAKEGVSSALWYDMGNAYSKGGFYGRALVCYERALRLDPQNSQAKANIKYIENKVADNNRAEVKGRKLSVDADSPSFFSNVRLYISRYHLSNTWATWGVAFFLLFVGCVALYVFSANVLARKIGFFGGFATLGVTIIFVVFAFMAASYQTNEGVVTEGKVKLLSDPAPSAKENPVALTRGTRMSVLDSIPIGDGKADWYKVRLNSDFVGWIASDNFECIDY